MTGSDGAAAAIGAGADGADVSVALGKADGPTDVVVPVGACRVTSVDAGTADAGFLAGRGILYVAKQKRVCGFCSGHDPAATRTCGTR